MNQEDLKAEVLLFFSLGLKAAPGPPTSAHRLANKASTENYEIPAVTKGKVIFIIFSG